MAPTERLEAWSNRGVQVAASFVVLNTPPDAEPT